MDEDAMDDQPVKSPSWPGLACSCDTQSESANIQYYIDKTEMDNLWLFCRYR